MPKRSSCLLLLLCSHLQPAPVQGLDGNSGPVAKRAPVDGPKAALPLPEEHQSSTEGSASQRHHRLDGRQCLEGSSSVSTHQEVVRGEAARRLVELLVGHRPVPLRQGGPRRDRRLPRG